MKKLGASLLSLLVALALGSALSPDALAKEVEVKMLNRGPNGVFFVFAPEVVRVEPGDSVKFVAADKGHDVYAVAGMVPQGAELFDGGMNKDLSVTFTVPGVYVVACRPHTAMGMLAVIVVGRQVNLEKIDPSALPAKARARLEGLLAPLK